MLTFIPPPGILFMTFDFYHYGPASHCWTSIHHHLTICQHCYTKTVPFYPITNLSLILVWWSQHGNLHCEIIFYPSNRWTSLLIRILIFCRYLPPPTRQESSSQSHTGRQGRRRQCPATCWYPSHSQRSRSSSNGAISLLEVLECTLKKALYPIR